MHIAVILWSMTLVTDIAFESTLVKYKYLQVPAQVFHVKIQ